MLPWARKLLRPRHNTIVSNEQLGSANAFTESNIKQKPGSPQVTRSKTSEGLKPAQSLDSIAINSESKNVAYTTGLPIQRSLETTSSSGVREQASSGHDKKSRDESPPVRSTVQPLMNLSNNDYLTEVRDILIPMQKTGQRAPEDNSAIRIFWPDSHSTLTDPEFDCVDSGQPQSLPNMTMNYDIVSELPVLGSLPEKSSTNDLGKFTTVVPQLNENPKRGTSPPERPTSPLKTKDVRKDNRQTAPLTVSLKEYEVKSSSPRASPVSKRALASSTSASALSPVPPNRIIKSNKRRQRGSDKSKQRYKTHGGISLTDDEKLLGRRDQMLPSTTTTTDEPVRAGGGLRNRRRESWRSNSLTEKPVWKIGDSTDDLLNPGVEKFKPFVPSNGAGVISMSQLHMFVLLQAGDELEENMEFEIIKKEWMAGNEVIDPMPTGDSISNSSKLQIVDVGGLTNVAYFSPVIAVNRYNVISTRIIPSASSSKDLVRQHAVSNPSLVKKDSNENNQYSSLHGQIQFSQGTLSQSRYVFLFPEQLFIAKQKSPTTFKLKKRIQLADIWLSSYLDEVSDVVKNPDRSFVIGWPTVNMVATFSSDEKKRCWKNKLDQGIQRVKSRLDEYPKLNVKIICREKNFSVTKCLSVAIYEDASQIVMRLRPANDFKDYQLWVTSGEVPLHALLGHECPYVIELNAEKDTGPVYRKKQTSQRHGATNVNAVNNDCHFMLCEKKPAASRTTGENRRSKSPLVSLFRRSKQEAISPTPPAAKLFGRALSEVCVDDKLPSPILDLLQFLYVHGPNTVGIFRKTASMKAVSDVRTKLDTGEVYQSSESSVSVAAGTLKEYLRTLPDCLLQSDLYTKWMEIFTIVDVDQRKDSIRRLNAQLPRNNETLLRYLICLLFRINEHSDVNNMTAFNLATCIGPSLLWANKLTVDMTTQMSDVELIRQLVVMLIDYAAEIFGEKECVQLFRELDPLIDPQERKLELQTSDSDSLHSVLRGEAQSHTSLDSFDNEFSAFDPQTKQVSPLKLSPASISHDSGLSSSNPLLYEDETASSLVSATAATPDNTLYEQKHLPLKSKASKMLQKLHSSQLSDISEGVQTAGDEQAKMESNNSQGYKPMSPTENPAGKTGRTARDRISRFQRSKSTSGDSQMGSIEENSILISSDDEALSGKSNEDEAVSQPSQNNEIIKITNKNDLTAENQDAVWSRNERYLVENNDADSSSKTKKKKVPTATLR